MIGRPEILQQVHARAQKLMDGFDPGHGIDHVERVRELALRIAKKEKADVFVVELGALLHDVGDMEFYEGKEDKSGEFAQEILTELHVDPKTISVVTRLVNNVSFKGESYEQPVRFLELDVVQDADRLDAIGAIGVARLFNFGGSRGRAIYDPSVEPRANMTKSEYKQHVGTSFNHFYEKLLLLKDKMNTDEGRVIAQGRHKYMEQYIEQFLSEVKGQA